MQIRLLVSLLAIGNMVAAANEQEPESKQEVQAIHEGRHLLQLGYTSIDGFDGDVLVLAPSYTFSYSGHLRFSAATQLLQLEPDPVGDSDSSDVHGLGDSFLSIQYDPGANLTSSPWVPDSLGLFGQLLVPSGDAEDGLGGDAWGASVGLGWPLPLLDSVLALPIVAYTRTFNHGDLALEFDEVGAGFTVVWNSPLGAWFAIEPFITQDFVEDNTHTAIAIAIGKSFANGFGIDLHWGEKRRVESFADRDDKLLLLNLNWQYGVPPRH